MRNNRYYKKLVAIYQNEISMGKSSNHHISASVAWGIFIAFSPIWGVQTLAAIGSAYLLKLNKVLVVAGSSISFVIAPFIIVLGYNIGKLILPDDKDLHIDAKNFSWLSVQDDLLTFVVGSFVSALTMGGFMFAISYFGLTIFRKKQSSKNTIA